MKPMAFLRGYFVGNDLYSLVRVSKSPYRHPFTLFIVFKADPRNPSTEGTVYVCTMKTVYRGEVLPYAPGYSDELDHIRKSIQTDNFWFAKLGAVNARDIEELHITGGADEDKT